MRIRAALRSKGAGSDQPVCPGTHVESTGVPAVGYPVSHGGVRAGASSAKFGGSASSVQQRARWGHIRLKRRQCRRPIPPECRTTTSRSQAPS
jgi:hypothetical protein